jgi:hypothetical protein
MVETNAARGAVIVKSSIESTIIYFQRMCCSTPRPWLPNRGLHTSKGEEKQQSNVKSISQMGASKNTTDATGCHGIFGVVIHSRSSFHKWPPQAGRWLPTQDITLSSKVHFNRHGISICFLLIYYKLAQSATSCCIDLNYDAQKLVYFWKSTENKYTHLYWLEINYCARILPSPWFWVGGISEARNAVDRW